MQGKKCPLSPTKEKRKLRQQALPQNLRSHVRPTRPYCQKMIRTLQLNPRVSASLRGQPVTQTINIVEILSRFYDVYSLLEETLCNHFVLRASGVDEGVVIT